MGQSRQGQGGGGQRLQGSVFLCPRPRTESTLRSLCEPPQGAAPAQAQSGKVLAKGAQRSTRTLGVTPFGFTLITATAPSSGGFTPPRSGLATLVGVLAQRVLCGVRH